MLTDTKLRSLKPKARPFRVADANGLCIEVGFYPDITDGSKRAATF
ncbi:hypothetical protein [Stenotrophomonas sp. PSU-St19]